MRTFNREEIEAAHPLPPVGDPRRASALRWRCTAAVHAAEYHRERAERAANYAKEMLEQLEEESCGPAAVDPASTPPRE